MRTFIELQEARDIVLESVRTLGEEEVDLTASAGRTLAGPAHSDLDMPPFDNSAMDGFAVRAADLRAPGAVLPIAGTLRAGEWPRTPMLPGSCWGITTGAPLPEGADAVVPVEETTSRGVDRVEFAGPVDAGRHVRSSGRDLRKGERVLEAGTVVDAAVAGMLAMIGMTRVPVCRVPSVSIITTGDELVAPETRPGPGQIRNSNASVLAEQVVAAGGRCAHRIHAKDSIESTRDAVEVARASDALVFSGGVSMGSHDVVRGVLEDAGMEPLFWKVKQRPGKPLLFGLLDGRPVFGLPGNPVSSSICFDQYVRPALARMLGRTHVWRRRFQAVLDEDFPKPAGLHVFARGRVRSEADGHLHVRPTGPQGSNLFTSVLRADCLVHLPADWPEATTGRIVEIERLRG